MSFPTALQMLQNYLTARAEWINRGQPLRTPEKIQELYNICSGCEHYKKSPLDDYFIKKFIIKDNDGMGCEVCGCFVNNNEEWNKLAWSTTRCPLETPKWLEEEEFQPKAETPPPPDAGGCGCGR